MRLGLGFPFFLSTPDVFSPSVLASFSLSLFINGSQTLSVTTCVGGGGGGNMPEFSCNLLCVRVCFKMLLWQRGT